jgi:hypothetical protein
MSELDPDCTCGECRTLLFVGGPIDGTRVLVPGNLRSVQVPTMLREGLVVAVYTRAMKDGDHVMVCPGAWPIDRIASKP